MILKNQVIAFVLVALTGTLASCAQNNAQQQSKAEKVKNIYSIAKSDSEWKQQLSAEQYYILRQKGTERPFTGKLLLNKEKGVYKCAACGNELFTDEMKFDSDCGWPSFDKEITGGKIIKKEDNSMGMQRTEILCAKCGGHLGHLFDDGPTATGQRYCVNSLSLEFAPAGKNIEAGSIKTVTNNIDTIVLGGGCFWCTEAVYEELEGVFSVVSGYSGGKIAEPSYHAVSSGKTGHAEVTQIVYDNTKISLEEVLKVFFATHDPTTLNRQGADAGTQYRSIVFYRTPEQKKAADDIVTALNKEVYDGKIVTKVEPFTAFYKAEEYHQDYYANNKNQAYCRMVIQPKLEKFEKVFKEKLKKHQ
jgi:peptide methionine sulfoxide reductase msrA/msrB